MQLFKGRAWEEGQYEDVHRLTRAVCAPGKGLSSQAQPSSAPSSPPLKACTPAWHSASPWACQAPYQGVGSPGRSPLLGSQLLQNQGKRKDCRVGVLFPSAHPGRAGWAAPRLPGTGWRSFQGEHPGGSCAWMGLGAPGLWGSWQGQAPSVAFAGSLLSAITWPTKPASTGTHSS